MFQKFSDLKKAKALQKTFAEEKVEMEDQGLKVVINGNMKIEEIHLDPQLKAEEQAERLKAQIEQKAREEAKEIIERAKREIELEKKGAISELRNATLENALKIASGLLKKSLTDEDHKKLAEEIFEHIDEIPAI